MIVTVWLAWHRGEFFGESEPPGPAIFAGVYATRQEALAHCWPKGDSRFIEEKEIEVENEQPNH